MDIIQDICYKEKRQQHWVNIITVMKNKWERVVPVLGTSVLEINNCREPFYNDGAGGKECLRVSTTACVGPPGQGV